jgi:hypothetical protein
MNRVREARRQPCHPEPVRKNAASAVAQNSQLPARPRKSSAPAPRLVRKMIGLKLESRSCRPSKRLPSCKIPEIRLIHRMYFRSIPAHDLRYLSASTQAV